MARAVLFLALLLPGLAHADGVDEIRQRVTLTAVLVAPHGPRPGLDLLLSERLFLTATVGGLRLEGRVTGQLGVRLSPRARLTRTRVRDLGVRLAGPGWTLDLGRAAVIGGGWRLVDGGQGLVGVGGGLEVGGWLGAVPDPFSTAPAPRFGGGPTLRLTRRRLRLTVAGEIAGTTNGLERLGVALGARYEATTWLDLSARADVQGGPPGKPVRVADLGLTATLTPRPGLRVRAGWNSFSGHAWWQDPTRDAAWARFARRAGGLDAIAPLADSSVSHQFFGSGRWTPTVPALGGGRGLAAVDVRYRHHAEPDRRAARATVSGGLLGVVDGRLDLTFDLGVVWPGEVARWEQGISARWTVDPGDRLTLEAGARLGLAPGRAGGVSAGGTVDLLADWRLPHGLTLSAGYSFTSEAGTSTHGALLRITWRHRWKRSAH